MESPARYLERRSAEVDRELTDSVKQLASGDEAAAFVRDHPLTALGGSAAAGFLATGLLVRSRGRAMLGRLLRLFRPLASAAVAGALRSKGAAATAAEDHPTAAG